MKMKVFTDINDRATTAGLKLALVYLTTEEFSLALSKNACFYLC